MPPSLMVPSMPRSMYPVGVKTKVSPGDNDEGRAGVAHHSALRAQHRPSGASVTKGCGGNEVILEATSAGSPALFPGGYEGKACPLPVSLLKTVHRCDPLKCNILATMKTF